MKQFQLEFIHRGWTCGDGCCSDQWYDVSVSELKDGKYVPLTLWKDVRDYFGNQDNNEDQLEWVNSKLKDCGVLIILTSDNCDIS